MNIPVPCEHCGREADYFVRPGNIDNSTIDLCQLCTERLLVELVRRGHRPEVIVAGLTIRAFEWIRQGGVRMAIYPVFV